MPSRIAWSTSAEASTGFTVLGGQSVEVDAIDQVSGTVPAKDPENPAVPVQLVVQPSSDPDDLRFFSLSASRYSDEITVTVDGGTEDIALEAPIFLMGAAVSKLLGAPPESLTVTNASEEHAVDLEILVGRLA